MSDDNEENFQVDPEENIKDKRWFKHTRGEFWGAPTANTKLYKFFAMFPITGFLGLDHLYLRSPWSFLLKFIVNIFTFGFWYFYDAAQALSFKSDEIDKYGLALPLIGPKGLGAGNFKGTKGAVEGNPEEAASPLMFLAYSILGMLPGGFDYAIVGDTWGFGIKFILSLFLLIFLANNTAGYIAGAIFAAPILLMMLMNIGLILFKPEIILCKGVPQYWPMTTFKDCEYSPEASLIKKASGAKNPCEPTKDCGDPKVGLGKFIFKNFTPMGRAASMAEKQLKGAISKNPMASKLLDKAQGFAGQVSKIQSAVGDKVAEAQEAVSKVKGAVEGAVEGATAAGTGLLGQMPQMPQIPQGAAISSQLTDTTKGIGGITGGLTRSASLSSLSSLLKTTKGGAIQEGGSIEINNPSTSLMFILALLLIGGTFMAGRRAINRIGQSISERPPEPFINLEEEENVGDTPPRPSES